MLAVACHALGQRVFGSTQRRSKCHSVQRKSFSEGRNAVQSRKRTVSKTDQDNLFQFSCDPSDRRGSFVHSTESLPQRHWCCCTSTGCWRTLQGHELQVILEGSMYTCVYVYTHMYMCVHICICNSTWLVCAYIYIHNPPPCLDIRLRGSGLLIWCRMLFIVDKNKLGIPVQGSSDGLYVGGIGVNKQRSKKKTWIKQN